MRRIFLAFLLLIGCSHEARIDRLEREVRRLKHDLSELEADWTLFQATPDGRWVYPKPQPTDENDRKKERKAKK
jgi:hypothetical protein